MTPPRRGVVMGSPASLAQAIAERLSATGLAVEQSAFDEAPASIERADVLVIGPRAPAQLEPLARLCEAAAGQMAARGFGRIVLLTSAAGLGGIGPPAEALVPGATVSLARSLARTFAARGVTVNAVALGNIDGSYPALAERVPLRRPGRAAEVAAAVEMLCAEDASYLTGQCLAVDGGMS